MVGRIDGPETSIHSSEEAARARRSLTSASFIVGGRATDAHLLSVQ